MSTKKAVQGGYATEETQKQVLGALGGGNSVDTANTTTVALGSDGVFTGAFTDVTTFAQILVTAASDVASAANGLELQYSNDGVTVHFSKTYDVSAGVALGQAIPSPVRGKFFRVRFTNSGTGQATFTLQTILKADTASGNPLEIEDALSDKDIVNNVKAVLHASESGVFGNVQRTGTSLNTSDSVAQASLANIDTSVDVTLSTRASEATLLTIDADTSALAGTVSGSEQQVDIVASLPTGTNNIGDVDVASITGILDVNNSSTALLGSDAVFTGLATDITNIASVVVNLFTDQASATDGFSLQFSSDGTNWDEQFNHPIAANQAETFVHTPDAQFLRIVYTNGAVAQGAFRLQTCLRFVGVAPISFRIGQQLTNDALSVVTRAVLSAKKPDLSYINIDATAGGNLKVSIEEVDVGADLAKETTLSDIATDVSTLAGTVSGSEQQVDIVASLPAGTNNIGDVDIASALPTGTNTIGAVNLNRLDIIDLLDGANAIIAGSTINGNAGAFKEVIASTAAVTQKVQHFDTTGDFLGWFVGPAASETLTWVTGPGTNETVEVSIASGSRITVRGLETTVSGTGSIIANFLG